MNPSDISNLDWRLQLLGAAVTALSGVLSLLVPVLVTRALRYVEEHTQIRWGEARRAAIISACNDATKYVEEIARQRLMQTKTTIPPDAKLKLAITFALDTLRDLGHDAPAIGALEAQIHASLADHRYYDLTDSNPAKPEVVLGTPSTAS